MILAAIDIGSNAGRLLIGSVFEVNGKVSIKKYQLTRVPLRLGEDVFSEKKLSQKKIKMFVKTMKAYKHLMDVYDVQTYKACATSAMREAENNDEIVKIIREETGIKLDIISGEEEAAMLFSTFETLKFDKKKSYLYIDVGGGSTEISLLENGEKVASESFKIGTIRLLKDKVSEKKWIEMKEWVKGLNLDHHEITAIGTGGNVNRLLKMNKGDDKNEISYQDIKRIQTHVSSYSLEDRIEKLGLRPDRADVIVPAADIYLAAMKYAEVTRMMVPKIGLADGILYALYNKEKKKSLLKS